MSMLSREDDDVGLEASGPVDVVEAMAEN